MAVTLTNCSSIFVTGTRVDECSFTRLLSEAGVESDPSALQGAAVSCFQSLMAFVKRQPGNNQAGDILFERRAGLIS